jgi:hypothetical protein
MKVDPYQIDNLLAVQNVASTETPIRALVKELGWILNHLADCVGSECHEFDREEYRLKEPVPLDCVVPHGWPDRSLADPNQGRKLFAHNLTVPEPFQHGWPFSDEAIVSDELLEVWDTYSHYFH